MKPRGFTKFDEEMGKALADRLGLAHDTTLRDWSAESSGAGPVVVTLSTRKLLTQEEFHELIQVATARVEAAEPSQVSTS